MTRPSTPETGLPSNDDASLMRWGADLGKIAPALREVHADQRKADAGFTQATAALTRIARQADSEQPASKRLAAEIEALAAKARELDAEADALAKRRQELIDHAETLPATFEHEHEHDRARMTEPRNGLQAEQRADIGAAMRDT